MLLENAQLQAPAKVNLSLEVLSRGSDGYHELDTVFCSLELADTLDWAPSDALRVNMDGMQLEPGADNLALRAARLLEQRVGHALPVALRITKRLPMGGGLGGGSADAGAVLFGLNRALDLGLSAEDLERLGARLGADVAFQIQGGTARGRGRGEQLERLPEAPPLPVVLVIPPFGCPTGQVYSLWEGDRPARGCSQRMAEALGHGDKAGILKAMGNDLEPAARRLRPELGQLGQLMLECGCQAAMLSGSGSTLFGLYTDPSVPATLENRLGTTARVVSTRLQGARR